MNATTEAIGIDDGFEAFYRGHFDHRLVQVTRAVGNRHDAEDIVQASFADLFKRWDNAEYPERLLSTIIRRQTCKHWRRQPFAKDVVVTPLGDEAEQIRAGAADPAVVAEQRDTIRRAGEKMTLMEREIVVGRFHQDTATVIAARAKTRPDKLRQRSRRMEQQMSTLIEPPQVGRIPLGKYAAMLPDRQRQVFELALTGWSSSEIAWELDITPNCASANLTHAKKTVTAMLHGANHVDAAYVVNRALWQARRRPPYLPGIRQAAAAMLVGRRPQAA